MLLKEMFSPLGGPKVDQSDVDWMDDLKFFIDNNTDLLRDKIFPAIHQHQKHKGHPKAYQLYIKPLEQCKESYCKEFSIDDANEKFPKEKLIELAKKMAEEQEKIIERGDYF
jgi:hypothetical protein